MAGRFAAFSSGRQVILAIEQRRLVDLSRVQANAELRLVGSDFARNANHRDLGLPAGDV